MLAHVYLFYLILFSIHICVFLLHAPKPVCPSAHTFADYQFWWSNCVPNFYVCIHIDISMLVSFFQTQVKTRCVCLLLLLLPTFCLWRASERANERKREREIEKIHKCVCFSLAFLCGFFFYVQKKLSNSGTTILSLTVSVTFMALSFSIARTHISAIRHFFV